MLLFARCQSDNAIQYKSYLVARNQASLYLGIMDFETILLRLPLNSEFWIYSSEYIFDIPLILVFMLLFCVPRLIPATFYPGRIILSLAFIIFCLRLVHIFTVSKTLGPKIIIVKRMVRSCFY